MKLIILLNERQTKVSGEDFIFLSGFSWSITKSKYVVRCGNAKGSTIYMHKIIAERAGLDCQNQIDHIDRNRSNNQRENLRAATKSQNGMNRSKQLNNTSGYKGVCWYKRDRKWLAQIQVDKKHINLGYFNTKEAAAFAYKIAAKKYHKEFAQE